MTDLTVRGLPRQRAYPRTRAKVGASNADRILMHIKEDSNGCWIWQLSTPKDPGYGRLTINGKSGQYAHRVAYETFVGPIPDGLELDHLCRQRLCCNPKHLEPVTPQINNRRGMAPGARALRRDMCLYGQHSYEEYGVVWSGRRTCRECRRIYGSLYRAVPRHVAEQRKRDGVPVVDLAQYFAERRRSDVAT